MSWVKRKSRVLERGDGKRLLGQPGLPRPRAYLFAILAGCPKRGQLKSATGTGSPLLMASISQPGLEPVDRGSRMITVCHNHVTSQLPEDQHFDGVPCGWHFFSRPCLRHHSIDAKRGRPNMEFSYEPSHNRNHTSTSFEFSRKRTENRSPRRRTEARNRHGGRARRR